MFIFFILFIILGIGVCGFIYYNSKDEINELLGFSSKDTIHSNENRVIKGDFDEETSKVPDKFESTKFSIKEVLDDLVQKLSFWKKKQLSDELDTVPMPSLQDVLAVGNDESEDEIIKEGEINLKQTEENPSGTASLKTEPSDIESFKEITSIEKKDENEKSLIEREKDINNISLNNENSQLQQPLERKIVYDTNVEGSDTSASSLSSSDNERLKDLEERYKKLDALFAEKTEELNITKRQLENEKKNRQEFEKVKELMQKEIEALKEKVKSLREQLDKVGADKEKPQIEGQQPLEDV